MPYYWTCPECGANLDPGEKCDCNKEEKEVDTAGIKWFTDKTRGDRSNVMTTHPGTDVAVRHRAGNSANSIGWVTEITFYRNAWKRITEGTWAYVGFLTEVFGDRLYFAPAEDGKNGARKMYQTKAPDRKQIKLTCDDFPDGDYVLEFDRSRGLFFISSDLNPFQKGQETDNGSKREN